MTNAKALLRRIAADVEKGKVRPAEFAKDAGVSLTSFLTMLRPDWENRAVANLEAVERAYSKLGKTKPRRSVARQ